MHLNVRLPKVEPFNVQPPTHCPLPDPNHLKKKCSGRRFKTHQIICRKPVRDTRCTQVIARRYRCLKCGRSFRVYPRGISRAQFSDTVKALCVFLYLLGVSYQGVADVLEALGVPIVKATVYEYVQAAGRRAIQLRKQWLKQQAGQVKVLGFDFTHVKCRGQEVIVAVATAALTGQALTIDLLDAETALRIETWIRQYADLVGAEVAVTDDADGLKTVADNLGLQHQICRAHVNRNVHDLIDALGTKALDHPDPVPWELPEASVDQFLEDLTTVESLIASVAGNGQTMLEEMRQRYQGAPPPLQGKKASMWYRLRRFLLDWSENWTRLSLYLRWRGEANERLDGTNNATEQVIGQCVKERYRSMRGYKRKASILNVSSLVGWLRMKGTDYSLGEIVTS